MPSCLVSSAKFSSAQAESGRQWNTKSPSQPNPGARADGTPCSIRCERNAALRWKRRFLLSVSGSVVSGRMKSPRSETTLLLLLLFLVYLARSATLARGFLSSVRHSFLFCRKKRASGRGRKKGPRSIFTLPAFRIYAITFARQARNELAEVKITWKPHRFSSYQFYGLSMWS